MLLELYHKSLRGYVSDGVPSIPGSLINSSFMQFPKTEKDLYPDEKPKIVSGTDLDEG